MKTETTSKLIKIVLYISVFGILLTTFIYYYYGHINFSDIDADLISSYGTFVGGIFISLITVLLVWITYTNQTSQLKESENLIRKQRFEDTFFNMLKVQQNIKESIIFDTSNYLTCKINQTKSFEKLKGQEVFDFAKEDFTRHYDYSKKTYIQDIEYRIKEEKNIFTGVSEGAERLNNDLFEKDTESIIALIKDKYRYFFDNYHKQFGHYFRHLYYILSFIEQAENEEKSFNKSNKKEIEIKYNFYAGIVQAQMSSSELFILFYNGIYFDKMRRKIERYEFVRNLSQEDLVNQDKHKNLYKGTILKSRKDI